MKFINRSITSSSDDSELEDDMGFEGQFSPTRSRINDDRFDTTTSQIIMNGICLIVRGRERVYGSAEYGVHQK